MSSPFSPDAKSASRPRFSAPFLRLLGQTLVAIALFHAAFQLFYWLPQHILHIEATDDTKIYYDAALRLRLGQDIYQPWPDFGPHLILSRFFYPPSFLLLTYPLSFLSYPHFVAAWCGLLLVSFWIYAACLAKMATGKLNWKAVLIAGLAISLFPYGTGALTFGNFEPVVWACYGVAFATSMRSFPLALGVMLKLHPLWTLLLVIKDEGKRALWPALLVIGLGTVGGVWLCGIHNAKMWWPATAGVVSQGTFFSGNVSLSFAGLRLLRLLGWHYQSGPLPPWAKLYLSVMALAAPALAAFWTRRSPRDLRYALTASATILFAPLCWKLYLPLLMSPLAILWRLKTAPEASDSGSNSDLRC